MANNTIDNKWGLNIISQEELEKGYWIETVEGNKYYISKNFDGSADVTTWIKGSGSTNEDINYGHFKEYIENGTIDNENVVYAFPHTYKDTMDDNFVLGSSNNEINQILSAEHISASNRSAISHSAGGGITLNYAATNIRENGITNPQTIVLEDPRIGSTGAPELKYTDETVNVLAQNKATVVSFESGRGILETLDADYRDLSNKGIKVIAIATGNDDHGGLREYAAARGSFSIATGNSSPLENITDKIYFYENGNRIQVQYDNDSKNWIAVDTGNVVEGMNDYILNNQGEIVNKNYSYTIGEDYVIKADFTNFKNKFNNLDFRISSDLSFLNTSVNKIKSSIKGTSSLNITKNPSSESTTRVPIQGMEIIYNYLTAVSIYLEKLTKEIQSALNIGQAIDNQDKELEEETEEIIDTPPVEETKPSEEIKPSPSPVIPPVVPSNTTTNINNNHTVEKPIEKEPTNPSQSNNVSSNNNQNNTSNNQTPPVQNDNSQIEETTSNIDFPKYEEIYSNDNQIVYNYNDECKLIIHHEGDQITGIEYYYDLGSKENAFNMFDEINNKYSSMEGFQEVIQNDRYVKVVLSNDYASQFNINDIKNKFSNLEEIIKGGINNG